MPIQGIEQPQILSIDGNLRLRRYEDAFETAFAWYRNEETVWLVDAVREVYDADRIRKMYAYQERKNELYWIERKEKGAWEPVGDVTLSDEDMAIVIGEPSARGQGIGRKVIACLMERARDLGWEELTVGEIYDWNEASRRLFTGLGFEPVERTKDGWKYRCRMDME